MKVWKRFYNTYKTQKHEKNTNFSKTPVLKRRKDAVLNGYIRTIYIELELVIVISGTKRITQPTANNYFRREQKIF